MKTFSLLLILSLLLLVQPKPLSAQAKKTQPPPQCPVLKVASPDSVFAGGTLTFTAQVQGGDPNVTPTYNWTVSAGSISSGQGTATIEMDLSAVAADSIVTATVDLGG